MSVLAVLPATMDIKAYAGDGWAVLFEFIDQETALPWPAAGLWEAQVRTPAASDEIVMSFNVDTSQQADGRIAISLSGDQTRALLDVKDARWDLQQSEGESQPRTWYRGHISATQDITRPGVG